MNKFKVLFKNKFFYISFFVLIIGILINQSVARAMKIKYGNNLPMLDDFILSHIPYLNVVFVFDLLLVFSLLLFMFYVYKKEFNKIPYFLLLFGIVQLIRGCFIGLTPFGSPKINPEYIGLFNGTAFKLGVFPSGHTGSTFLAFLLAKGWWKYFFLFCSVIVMILLLLGRGHYSIDILSGIIFVWWIYFIGEKYLKDKFCIKEDETD